jgi:glycosyltransferase involved in cell wall biosynthesis
MSKQKSKDSNNNLIIFMPSMEGGGVEKNIILISNFLVNYIKNITLITFDKKFSKFFDKNINIIYPKNLKKKNYSKYFKYFVCLIILVREIFKEKKSLVFSFQANIYCLILSKLLNFRIIIRSNSSPSGWNKDFVKNLIFKFFLKRANSIIVNSLEFKNELKNKFNANANVIYNPLNKNEILKRSKEYVNFNFFKSKKYLKIINIARFTDQKDHITIIKAFNVINKKIDSKLLLMGYGQNRNLIINLIKKYKLNKKIKILPYQNNPFKYLKMSDVFVLSSLYEGLPNVLLESLTLKKFIISSNCKTGPAEILKKGKFGLLFAPGDYRDLANKIIYFYKNKKKLKKKTEEGFNSLDRFDLEKNCLKYFKIIKNNFSLIGT